MKGRCDKLSQVVVTKIASICYEWENKSFAKGYEKKHFVQKITIKTGIKFPKKLLKGKIFIIWVNQYLITICKAGSLKYVKH